MCVCLARVSLLAPLICGEIDGDINERLIKNNSINDGGAGGAVCAAQLLSFFYFGDGPNSHSHLVRLCIFLIYLFANWSSAVISFVLCQFSVLLFFASNSTRWFILWQFESKITDVLLCHFSPLPWNTFCNISGKKTVRWWNIFYNLGQTKMIKYNYLFMFWSGQ